MNWLDFKDFAADLGLAKDALHIYVAFAIHIASAALLRRPLSSWIPWTCILIAELLNELMDIYFGEELQLQQWQVLGARHDVLNTMALPTLMLLLCRFAPGLFRERAAAPVQLEGNREDLRSG